MNRTYALPFALLVLAALACLNPFIPPSTPDVSATAARQTQIMQQALTEIVASLTAALPETAVAATTLLPTLHPTATLPPTDTPTAALTPTLTPTLTSTLSPTPEAWVETTLAQMSLAQKIGQMLMIGVEGQAITPATCSLIGQLLPGAIVYRGGNVATPEQLRQFSAGLQDCASRSGILPLWVALDHEGQYVNRFQSGAAIFPMALALGATDDPQQAYRTAFASGQELAYSGVNLVLGPDADILTNYDNSVISLRSYGGDPARASLFVAQAVRGYLAAGVAPVLKHFPGHGGVAGDTHEVLAVDAADEAALRQTYFPPFQAGIAEGAPAVMFSHVAFPALDGITQPASVSPVLVHLLHNDLAFQGFALTDSMGMGAITHTYGNVGAASLKAASAGIDMLLLTSAESAQTAYTVLLSAAKNGQLPLERIDQAARRILTAKARWGLTQFPVTQGAAPDWTENREVVFDLGYRAITLMRNQWALIPLSIAQPRLLVIGPTDGWGLYPALQGSLQTSGFTYNLVTFSGPWNGAVPERNLLQSLPTQAASYDVILIFTWEAHLNHLCYDDNFQAELVNRMLATGKPVVVVALKSPTDLLEFPQAHTFLATYGTTAGQVQGIVDALLGQTTPAGINPLPGLP